MTSAYAASDWTALFAAGAGACATLMGLLFVAVSINVQQILSLEGLPERAFLTLMLLLGSVLSSIAALIPGQSDTALGLELLLLGVCLGLVVMRLLRVIVPALPDHVRNEVAIGLVLPGTVPLLVGGASVLAEAGGGLYWIAAAIAGAILGSVANAWVLLIEILR
jgi:hypothetical protein